MDIPYWNKEIETADRATIEKIQFERLGKTLSCALRSPFYKRLLGDAGISSGGDIKSLDDLRRIPFTTKDDLRKSFPKGMMSVDMQEVVRIHSSSGTRR